LVVGVGVASGHADLGDGDADAVAAMRRAFALTGDPGLLT
jgi:hypothetical protein